jgi:multiple sugar transport system ATP-binding protein
MGDQEVDVEGHRLPLAEQDGYRPGEDVQLGLRAENVEVTRQPAAGALPAEVGVVEPLGSHLLLTVTLGGQVLKVQTRTDFPVAPHDQVWLRPEIGSIRLLGRFNSA